MLLVADNFIHGSRTQKQQLSPELSKAAAAYVQEPSSEEEEDSEDDERAEHQKAVDSMLTYIKAHRLGEVELTRCPCERWLRCRQSLALTPGRLAPRRGRGRTG